MKQLRHGARVLLLSLMIISSLASSLGTTRAAAQAGVASFTSPMTGVPIQASAPWSIDPASVMSEEGIESITLTGEFEFMQVWFMPGTVDLVEARDVVLDSFAQTFGTFVEIDRGAYGNVSYSLDITTSEGVEFGVFSLFLGQRASGYVEYYVFFGALSLFAQGFASAQQHVTVNGTAVFDGVDGAGLQNLLLANAGVTGASTTTTTQAPPVPTSEPSQPQSQPTQPPAPPTQAPQQPADPGTTTSPEGAAYLAALEGEAVYLETTIADFLNAYMSRETNDAWVEEMNRVTQEWANYPQRAAAIVAPAGFEAIDTQYRSLVTYVEGLALSWNDVIAKAQASDPTAMSDLAMLALDVAALQTEIDALRTAMSSQVPGATTQPTQAPADQPTQAPADQPTQAPQQPAGGLTQEQAAYIETIRAESTMLLGSLDEFVTLFGSIVEGTAANPDQTIADINAILDMWAAYPGTAAQNVAPAGMEDVDIAYQQLANDLASLAEQFRSYAGLAANSDPGAQAALETFITQLEALYGSLESLNALLDQKEAAGTTTTTTTAQPTQPPAQPTQPPAETPTQPAGTADGDAYLATIATEMDDIQASIASFAEGFQLLGATDAAEQERGITMIEEAVNYWSTYDQVAAGIVAPAGFEDIDAAYRQLAGDVTNLATLFSAWIDAPEASQAEASEAFSAALDDVQVQIEDVRSMLGGTAPTGSTTANAPATEETPEAPANVPGDVTETGNRGELPQPPGGSDSPQDSGATNGDLEELGLVADDEYASPQLGIEIVWDDRWAFDAGYIEDAIGSDPESGEDWITLVWTGGDGGDITLTVAEADGTVPDDAVAFWESDEYTDQFDMPAEVVLSDSSDDRGGVLILLDDGADGLALYREAVCLSRSCDEIAYVMVVSTVIDAADLIADAEEGIEVGGESATGVFSTREINRALDQ